MKGRNIYKMKVATFVEIAVKKFVVGDYLYNEDDDLLFFNTKYFRVRILLNGDSYEDSVPGIHFGVIESFDRWGNSVDYELNELPDTIEDVQAVFLAAEKLYEDNPDKNYDEAESVDLATYYRKMKVRINRVKPTGPERS